MLEAIFQDGDLLRIAGIVSALLGVCAYYPYARDILRGHTHPQRASWLIWSVLCTISFFSQLDEGAQASLWFAGIQVTGTAMIFLLSLRFGRGRVFVATDFIYLGAAAVGLMMWAATSSSVYALGISIGVSLLAGIATVRKSYRAPGTETLSKWVINCCAAGLAVAAVGRFDPVLMAYPLYLMVLNGSIVAAILLGRARHPAPVLVPIPVPVVPNPVFYRRHTTDQGAPVRARAA